MTKQEIKTSRKEIQKLIKESKHQLELRIKVEHPKLIRLIKKNYDVSIDNLLDAGFYDHIEDCLDK